MDHIVEWMTRVEGMTGVPSAWIMSEIMAQQGGKGDMLDLGSYKGRSAAILASGARSGETVYAVEPEYDLDTAAIGPELSARIRLLKGRSEDVPTLLPDYKARFKSFRFIHEDASHTFDTVRAGLVQANNLLAPHGVLAVDDFGSSNYPQVVFGVGAAIFADGCDLRPFLIGDNKAYFCRKAAWRHTIQMAVEHVGPRLLATCDWSMVRTDDSEWAPLSLRGPEVSDENGRYAPSLYGHFIDGWLKA